MTTNLPTGLKYRGIKFYPPIGLSQETTIPVMLEYFKRFKSNEPGLDAKTIFTAIYNQATPDLKYNRIAFNENAHDANIARKFPIIWKQDDAALERAITISPNSIDNNRMILSATARTVIIGEYATSNGEEKPFMFFIGQEKPGVAPDCQFHPESLEKDVMDMRYVSNLHHLAVDHLLKKCLGHHPESVFPANSALKPR